MFRFADATTPARRRARRSGEAGFTLTELMVTIFIIGLLATVVTINVLPMMDRGRVQKAEADVAAITQALEMYRLDMGDYPPTDEGLEALVLTAGEAPPSPAYRPGGYIQRLPMDPWNRPYQYLTPGQFGQVDVFSLGADGELDGEGLNADIGNW